MDRTILGNTGLEVSVAGLGTGGGSRLGRHTGKSFEDSVRVVHEALDLGINLIDMATAYHTHEIVGAALKTVPRDKVVLSTKHHAIWQRRPAAEADMVAALDGALKALGTDHVDIFHVHSIRPDGYDHTIERVVPALLKEKEKGKFRFLGGTESGPPDPEHEVARRALDDGAFDVLMIAYSMLQQNARDHVLPKAIETGTGIMAMYAVRNILSFPGRLKEALEALAKEGSFPRDLADKAEPLDFLLHDGGALSMIDAAYRYVRHTPGVHVTLFGTGDLGHLHANVASLERPPLPESDQARLAELFGDIVGLGMEYGEARG